MDWERCRNAEENYDITGDTMFRAPAQLNFSARHSCVQAPRVLLFPHPLHAPSQPLPGPGKTTPHSIPSQEFLLCQAGGIDSTCCACHSVECLQQRGSFSSPSSCSSALFLLLFLSPLLLTPSPLSGVAIICLVALIRPVVHVTVYTAALSAPPPQLSLRLPPPPPPPQPPLLPHPLSPGINQSISRPPRELQLAAGQQLTVIDSTRSLLLLGEKKTRRKISNKTIQMKQNQIKSNQMAR